MRAILPLLCAGVLASCGPPSFDHYTLEEIIEGAVEASNKTGREGVPGLQGDITYLAEPDTLVVRITNVPTGNYTLNENWARREWRPHACGNEVARTVIERGGKIRMELVSNTGVAAPPVTFARCPTS